MTVFSPAKLNFFLAVTGRRPDGYHELVSVAALLDFGDELQVEGSRIQNPESSRFTLECDSADVPVDGTNLVLKAAAAFAAATGWRGGAAFRLTKRIPLGAGLGGGSSNAVAVLRALNQLTGGAAGEAQLADIAATLGADCPLFLPDGPVVMRGRGERVELLPAAAAARLRGRRVLLFKPDFPISTAWAYDRMAAEAPRQYVATDAAEARLTAWRQSNAPAEELLFNNMEGVAFAKFIALPVLLEKIRREFGVATQLSGSGSACFALLRDDFVAAPLAACIRECWGPGAFLREARLA